MKRLAVLLTVTAVVALVLAAPLHAGNEFDALTEGQQIADFKLKTIYENEYGDAVGAQFRHVPSGFVLDIMRIQSVPQGFIWVNTPPPTDMGEPHTLEHLVLGKGPKAQWVASYEDMSLSSSSAGTGQLSTGYHYHTAAGKDVFFKLMEVKLDALLNPDYTDEEIRREMCNLGYSVDPTNSAIQLEEKGSVYTEMVSAYESAWSNLSLKLDDMMYGSDHPLSNSSGGYPPAIREATAEDLKKFHGDHYHLNNMGMVLAIGDEIGLEECLTHTSEICARIEPDAVPGQDPTKAYEKFPAPELAPFGTIAIADFPHNNEKEPGLLIIAWPPVLDYDWHEVFLCQRFMSSLASGESSNLYKRFIDSQTRLIDIGASSVWGWSSDDQGCPISVGFSNVSQDIVNEEMIDSVRGLVLAEIEAVANYADDSEELKNFNDRVANDLIRIRRQTRANLNKPPGFGYRGASWWWPSLLQNLYRIDDFRKNLTTPDRLEFVEKLLASGKNFWKDYIAKWKLLENLPYAAAARPNPEMISRMEQDRDKRIAVYVAELKKKYGVRSEEVAIEKFVAEYDARTAEIDARSAAIEMPGFIDNPPLSLDPLLEYREEKLPGGGDNMVATFDNITSAEVGLYLNMNVVPESLLVYVSALPTMLMQVGVIKDGQPLAYDETNEMIRREILGVRANYDINYANERVELRFKASGSTTEESLKAMEWLSTFLYDADWREENLPRMRDAIDFALTAARNGMKGSEESWVQGPASAYWKQTNPLVLSAGCFLTKQHSLLRMKWLLKKAPDPAVQEEFSAFMSRLGDYGGTADRAQLRVLGSRISSGQSPEGEIQPDAGLVEAFGALSEPASGLVKTAVGDLAQCLSSLPDESVANDWKYLCQTITADLTTPPTHALDNFLLVMELIRAKDNVRGYLVGSEASQKALFPSQKELVDRFSDEPSVRQVYSSQPVVHSRLRARTSPDIRPLYVGLINESTRNGVFINTAPCASFMDTDPEVLLDFLASRLYGGGGAHSMFMKTWAAGLAYSNGLRSNQSTGRLMYYAERCPSLVQTMQFVVSELKNARPDSSLTDYAVAQAFGSGRGGASYEGRTEAMAENLADGLPPDKVGEFRKGILELRKRPDLYERLTSRMLEVYGAVLPGLEPMGSAVDGANYFMIGPETQFKAFEEYLKTVEGSDVTLYRIYPRDYWVTATN